MVDGGQLAGLVGTQCQSLPCRRPMAGGAIHLLAAQHELDRPADHTGRNDAKNLRTGDKSFGAKTTADEGAADVDLVRRHAEQTRQTALGHRQALGRRVDRECVTVPVGDDGVGFHGVVILRWCLVGRIDVLGGCGDAGRHIALVHHGGIACTDDRRHEAVGGIEVHARRLGLVTRSEQGGAFGRRLERFGHDNRDRLVGIPHAIVLQ